MSGKSIGIIGGMSPESTVTYYETIVHTHHRAEGDHDYPRILIGSVPFGPISDACHDGEWERVRDLVQSEADALAAGGADFLLIAANTIHKVVPDLTLPRPLLAIYDAAAATAREGGYRSLGLTGTEFTMSGGFFREALEERGLEVVIPGEADRERIHRMIYDDLVRGEVTAVHRAMFSEIGERLLEAGADAVLLACTELEMLTREDAFVFPSLDTTTLHAKAAWAHAMGRKEYPLVPAAAG
ncbi:MAG: amino acid racemase [bacterium]